MKNILLLYKKLYVENKTIVLLYLLLFTMVLAISLTAQFYSSGDILETDEDKKWFYKILLDNSWIISGAIVLISLGISVHWGIRHFNYSHQRNQYNTLPLSIVQKFGFISSYAFILLPVLHTVLLFSVFLITSKIGIMRLYNKNQVELLIDWLGYLKADYSKWFLVSHIHLFISLFVLIALFFNKMGFIKTAVSGFIIMISGMLLYMFLNEKLWETRGDFGTAQSIEKFPNLYILHYISVTVMFAFVLYTIYVRLTDKNY